VNRIELLFPFTISDVISCIKTGSSGSNLQTSKPCSSFFLHGKTINHMPLQWTAILVMTTLTPYIVTKETLVATEN
jgi:hypothetical protein